MIDNNLNEQIEKARNKYYGCFIAFAASLVLGIFILWLRLNLQGIEVELSDGVTKSEAREILIRHFNEFFWIVVPSVIVMFFSVVIGIKSALDWARLDKLQKQLSNSEIQSGVALKPDAASQAEDNVQSEAIPESESTSKPQQLDTDEGNSAGVSDSEDEKPKESMPVNDIISENTMADEEEPVEGHSLDIDSDVSNSPEEMADKLITCLKTYDDNKYMYGCAFKWLKLNGSLPGINQTDYYRFLTIHGIKVSKSMVSLGSRAVDDILKGAKVSVQQSISSDYERLKGELEKLVPKNSIVGIKNSKESQEKVSITIGKD